MSTTYIRSVRFAHFNRVLSFLALHALCLSCVSANAEAIEVMDGGGNLITLASPAKRIVSLAPHLTEILYAAGLGEKIVGAVDYSDYPKDARSIPRIGAYNRIDIESLIGLKPDLVVAWKEGNGEKSIEAITSLGVPVYLNAPRDIDSIATTIQNLGRLGGNEAFARQTADHFRAQFQILRQQYANRQPISVYYQISPQPLMTLNKEHVVSQLIEMCGGHNVFSDLSVIAPVVTVEGVLKANPEVIIASGMTGGMSPEGLGEWRKWPDIEAVKRDNLYHISADLLQRQGPRMLQGAQLLCWQLDEARKKRGPEQVVKGLE